MSLSTDYADSIKNLCNLWIGLLAKFCTFPYNDRPLLPFPLICRRTPANRQNLPGVVCPCNVRRSQDEHCLVVDDSATIRRRGITSLGSLRRVKSSQAGSGLEAIERLAIEP